MLAGFESTRDDGKRSLVARMPNGVNWYLPESKGLKSPLGPRKQGSSKPEFVPLQIPYLEKEEDRTDVINRLNEELTSIGSKEKPIYSLVRNGNEFMTPMGANSFPLPIRENSHRWRAFIESNYSSPSENGKRDLKKVSKDDLVPAISPFFVGEPETTTISMPWLESVVEAEYIAKAGYIEACLTNQWLIPYADRLGWRFVEGTASIIVPYWSNADLEAWSRVQYIGSSKEGFLMSDGKRYPYPADLDVQIPNVFTTDPNLLMVDGQTFDFRNVSELEYPSTNRRQKAVARIVKEIREGLVPFDPPYPIVELDDADIRIVGREITGMAVISITPNNVILGIHSGKLLTKALQKYRQLWRDGELLNDYGHVKYSDSYSELDERGIKILGLTDEDI